MLNRHTLRIGKKLCFPDVPSTWIPRTVESILHSQDCYYRKPNLADAIVCHPTPPKNNDFEADNSRSCNLLSSYNKPEYDSGFYPAPPNDAYLWSYKCESITSIYDSMDIDPYTERVSYKEGQKFDVISLLSTNNVCHTSSHTHADHADAYLVRNNGDVVRVESLRGKNILVCCVLVPSTWVEDTACSLRAVVTYCAHQNSKLNTDSNNVGAETEIVLVAKMRANWTYNNEDAFNHFFSGFPSSWLAVPFSDKLRRDHICTSIGLVDHPIGLLVDPDQKVVFHRNSFLQNSFYSHYFCSDPNDSILWWKKYNQLDLILGLDSHYVFSSTNDYDSDKKVSLSELKKNVVGLYLCIDGSLIQTLDIIYQECKARNQEFEVVLVYLPYKDEVNPPMFQEAINHVLRKLNISNWWVSPFDDFVSRRLWEAVEFSMWDELVILDPHKNIADPFANGVLKWFGVNAYPFTREYLVRRELEAIKAVTLESLLVYDSSDHVLRIDDHNNVEKVPIDQLRGKTVILYVDNVQKPVPVYYRLLEWYNRIKTTTVADDFEVVFVSDTPFGNPKLLPVPMPWLVCPFNLQHTTFVSRKLLKSGYSGYLVSFSTDGHIINLNNAEEFINTKAFPSYNSLCEDVISFFHRHYETDIDMTGVVPSQFITK